LPIAGYTTDGPSPEVSLYDTRRGDDLRKAARNLAEVGSAERSAADPRSLRVATSGGALGLEDADCLAVVALAGAVAEVGGFGRARGIQSDLAQLNFLLSLCRPKLGGDRVQSQTRWAARAAQDLMVQHEPQLKACVEAFRAKQSIAECIAAIESASSST
jgi:hypothetical protein